MPKSRDNSNCKDYCSRSSASRPFGFLTRPSCARPRRGIGLRSHRQSPRSLQKSLEKTSSDCGRLMKILGYAGKLFSSAAFFLSQFFLRSKGKPSAHISCNHANYWFNSCRGWRMRQRRSGSRFSEIRVLVGAGLDLGARSEYDVAFWWYPVRRGYPFGDRILFRGIGREWLIGGEIAPAGWSGR